MSNVNLASRLRIAIRGTGRSVNEIAKSAGVRQQVLQRFIAGTRQNLRLDTIEKLMDFLEIDLLDRTSAHVRKAFDLCRQIRSPELAAQLEDELLSIIYSGTHAHRKPARLGDRRSEPRPWSQANRTSPGPGRSGQ